VVVLERGSVAGGAAGSFDVAGVRVDHGSHRLHPTTDPAILAELRELLGDDLQLRRRHGRIRLAGRWIAFPLKPADLVRRLPPGFALGAARDAALAPVRRARDDTFAAVLRAKLGPTMCERFYFPYARKLWGLEPEELSGEQARRRVSADSPLKLAARALRGSRGTKGVFWYPRRGYGQLWEALADAARAEGADVRFEVPAVRLEPIADGVAVVLEGGERVEAARCFSTVPLPALARLAGAPEGVLAASGELRLRSMVLVYLVLERDRYTPFDAHYLPGPETPVTRVSEPKNYRDGPDPAGRTVLCAELPCSRDDEVWAAGEDELGAMVVRGLVEAGLPDPAPSEVVVRRLPAAYPIYRVGWERPFAVLDAWASAQPRLVTFGRQGLFAHDNAHHALAMARAAVGAIRPGGGFDDAAWVRARERFARHVVED
jgi:protoporphyrinogen oxidase